MAVIPKFCPDCLQLVNQRNPPSWLNEYTVVYGVCVGCGRHFHGLPSDYEEANWVLPNQSLPQGAMIATGDNRQEVSSSDPERQETL